MRIWIKYARVLSLLIGAWCVMPAYAKPFDCTKKCGLPADAPYNNLIVGTIDGVATEQQSKKIFAWARSHGYWKSLPASDGKFWKAIQLVSLRVKGKRSVTVLISQTEAKAAPFILGDWGRYAPHRGGVEKPAEDDKDGLAYWNALGCVLVICRGEASFCEGHYVSGIYRTSDGIALKDDGRTVDIAVRSIDPYSMLPK
ncbi:hypothetical protein [Uliginosibacterium gangwonense]|uniref:hypothetical protein n=1 Tax=Uliginosibacterium gangwonense TaxID=392736 RepID=UPI000378835C|nr:hypothetical protein [Uliginosibacterium gangwonense]